MLVACGLWLVACGLWLVACGFACGLLLVACGFYIHEKKFKPFNDLNFLSVIVVVAVLV
jgi:Ni/Fe-hydrogenase subunit HybB-like protein